MKSALPPILMVDDEPNMRATVSELLMDDGYTVDVAESGEQAVEMLAEQGSEYFMMITDGRLGGMSGYELLKKAKTDLPKMPVILITAFATPKLAVEAIQNGAVDYLSKPFAPEELLHAVDRCREHYDLKEENKTLRARSDGSSPIYQLHQIVGDSPKMIDLRKFIETVAPTDSTVLILGESGTGKELVAGSIHHLSARAEKNYIRLNCAAIPENLLESELFGHVQGAFTDAREDREGKFELASRGTLLLDEIGDMSLSGQAKLLRVLEDKLVVRVGGSTPIHTDARVIAATNQDLNAMVREKKFREDLFYRLNVMTVEMPPLRERGNDIILLAEYFLKELSARARRKAPKISASARKRLQNHNWPGNIRELRNIIERIIYLSDSDRLEAEDLPLASSSSDQDFSATYHGTLNEATRQFQIDLIRGQIKKSRGNMSEVARQLGLHRSNLYRKMGQLGMELEDGTS